MAISINKLNADLHNIIEQVTARGLPVEIEWNGHIIKITAKKPKNKLDNLIRHPDLINGNPEELVHIDWSSYWTEKNNL